jgi:REP element-mobilizing transposase RayT
VYTKYKSRVYAYALMDNHYHLLIESKKANLSKIMHYLNVSYTVYFNKKYKRTGYLFGGRYKALIVEKDPYLLELFKIHPSQSCKEWNSGNTRGV